MVNFSEKLEANKHEGWPYVDYKHLKKVLKALDKEACSSSRPMSPSASMNLISGMKRVSSKLSLAALQIPLLEGGAGGVDARNIFHDKLREQRDKVQAFHTAELERSSITLQSLLGQFEQSSSGGKSVSTSLQRASTDLYRTLQLLRNYSILNYTALIKICKKFDKEICKRRGYEPLLKQWTAELGEAPFVSPDALDSQCSRLETAFAAAYCDGSVHVARASLLVRKSRSNAALLISVGMRSGVCFCLLVWLAWDITMDVRVAKYMRGNPMWQTTQLPLFRAGLAAVVVQLLWALCLQILSRARINFQFMLDFSSRVNTSAAHAFSSALRAAILYLVSLLLFLKALIGDFPNKHVSPGIFPVAMFLCTFGSLFLPIQQGGRVCRAVGVCLAAPCHPVDFASVLAADVLTSMVKPLQDAVYSLCYIFSAEFTLPYSEQGTCAASPIYKDIVVPLLCALPLWARFMQCLRVAHDTGKRVPALPNALKYAISLLVVLFGVAHPALVAASLEAGGDVNWIHVAWLCTYFITTLCTAGWTRTLVARVASAHSTCVRVPTLRQTRSVGMWSWTGSLAS